ncbi:hypothetical protein [Virgisporangium ochraceum]|uniref:Ankyrin n=1 Tax=Virgisporangium ochraceum TaxID=65505 RepID=A0A8J4EDV1_9ACTN|nr:hypothetical protein [Virgisporangium ochraceum]GIJ71051.1 hypothetical protein Voc01_059680 [Virgisporangium ochraceum]
MRRYDLGVDVVHAATVRRYAGDWRGACRVTRVDLDLTLERLDGVPAFEDDMRHLAPEVLRWHLLRGDLEPLVHRQLELARYGKLSLVVRAPRQSGAPVPLVLLVVDGSVYHPPRLPRCVWDVRHLDGLRDAAPPYTWYLDPLNTGDLAPSALPPLVRTAVFSDRPRGPYLPAPGVSVPERFHVQCHRARHYVGWRDGELRLLSHGDADRERVLHALGARRFGCFEVEHAWERRAGRLPRRMRAVARHLYLATAYGDAAEVARLLDAGVDPRGVRGPQGQSLLHVADGLDPAVVRRLLDAGLDPDLRDNDGRRTALRR